MSREGVCLRYTSVWTHLKKHLMRASKPFEPHLRSFSKFICFHLQFFVWVLPNHRGDRRAARVNLPELWRGGGGRGGGGGSRVTSPPAHVHVDAKRSPLFFDSGPNTHTHTYACTHTHTHRVPKNNKSVLHRMFSTPLPAKVPLTCCGLSGLLTHLLPTSRSPSSFSLWLSWLVSFRGLRR